MKIIKLLFLMFLISCGKDNDTTPELATFNLKEQRIKLEDLFIKNSPLLITFWSETCGVCMQEIKELENNFNNLNFAFINIDGEKVNTLKTAEKFNLNQEKILKDQLNITAQRYELKGTPSSFLISQDKKLLKKFIGKVNYEELNSYLNQLKF